MKINVKAGLTAAVAVTAVVSLAACSTGGAPSNNAGGGAAAGGGGGDSGYTFAMITHESPGDTF